MVVSAGFLRDSKNGLDRFCFDSGVSTMSQSRNSLPKYRRKIKSNGPQAVVSISGKEHYLGAYGSKASKALYDQLVSDWLAAGRPDQRMRIAPRRPVTVL